MPMCDIGDEADICQAECGIARTFDPYEFSFVRPDQVRNVELDAWGKGNVDAVSGGDFGKVAVCAAVDVGDGDDMGACSEGL